MGQRARSTPPQVAVIPAAGRGTRMRPATRSVPKALLPVVDRPAVQHVVEEAVRAGVAEVVIVVDPDAAGLVDRHFHADEPLPGLEHVEVRLVVQDQPRGLGDAVLTAAPLVGDRAFFCLLADVLMPPGRESLRRLAEAGAGATALSLRRVPETRLGAVGVVEIGRALPGGAMEIRGAVEKPAPGRAPSGLSIVGRYLFDPLIFKALDDVEPGYGGEIQLTDAIALHAAERECVGVEAGFDVLDLGTPFGLAHASGVMAAAHPEWGRDYVAALNTVTSQEVG